MLNMINEFLVDGVTCILICSVSSYIILLISGTRGMGTIRRTILGSVSDHVVHHAHCPVLVCRQ